MHQRLLDQFELETQLSILIMKRDAPRRVAGIALILLACAFAGPVLPVLAIGMLVLLFEVTTALIMRRVDLSGPRLSLAFCYAILAMRCGSLVVFLSPAILLVRYGHTSLLLVGFVWIFGCMVHVSNSNAALPIHNWCLMVPSFGFAAVVVVLVERQSYQSGHPTQTVFALAFLLVYCVNTVETMLKQKDTLAALDTARDEAHARLKDLEYLTTRDPLTGLKNRRAFDTEFQQMLNIDATGAVVFLLDLDGFKPVNDSYSHAAGDALLCGIAKRLSQQIGSDGLVARLGGDEFAIARRGHITPETAVTIGEELLRTVREPVIFEQRELSVGASIGAALATDRSTITQLISQADQAMYRAKLDSSNRVVVYDARDFPVRLTLDHRADLIRAMQSGQFQPYYQPKIDLETGEISGCEALGRWLHPDHGLVMPGSFLPQINELGLQGDFVSRMLGQTLQHIDELMNDGISPGDVSVNIPEVTLATTSGREALIALLRRHPMALPSLTFEVTEDIFIARSCQMIQESIAQFRRLGVRISLDDFGTGFASFEHLRELEFDELKLDTSFVKGLGQDDAANVLVKAFLDIGRGLHVTVVAEGVETAEQHKLLLQMGCQTGQGFLFSKAIPFGDLRAKLKAQADNRQTDAA